ncbi:hypothetical protein GCM10023160_08590 [Brachybacterium paraconglomeratum]|uniref:DUF6541 family protein n=1 Tax=Brachybacterium paraconglomeratum TaxID=173362 RepID=UPI0031EEDB21
MMGLTHLLLVVLLVLVATYLPGYIVVRALAGSRLLALAFAPALGAAAAGIGAMIAPFVGLDWTLLAYALASAVLVLLSVTLARLGIRLPATVLDGPLLAERRPSTRLGWGGALTAAIATAVMPIAVRAGGADAVLERYDTLFHLTALQHIRDTGNGSSLELNAVASSTAQPASYPAAFHDLAALVPSIDIPIVLNGSALALAIVPWVLGTALLARVVYPEVSWAPPAVAVVAAVIPASPLNLWVHLSPLPNLVGFAALAGALAGAVALWKSLTASSETLADAPSQGPGASASARPWGPSVATLAVVGFAGAGLTLLQPNVGVTALILLAVLTTVTGFPLWRTRPWLIAIPVLAVLPVAALTYTPLGARVTGFTGGLQVPWWSALGEVGLGLLTIWPMALGVLIAALWWPGLVTSLTGPHRWLPVAWLVMAVIYLDAAVDSPLNLSVLFFRGQDRIAIPLAMLSCVLIIPGIRWYADRLRISRRRGRPLRAPLAAALVVVAALGVLSSVPTRLDNAAKNFAQDYPGRGRFLQADELTEFARFAPQMDHSTTILASPYSGAAHMYALHGLPAYFPVAGVALTDEDRAVIEAVPLAGSSPEHCRLLREHGIGYVYQERRPYQFDPAFTSLGQGGDDLGTVVFETDHSRLLRVECSPAS